MSCLFVLSFTLLLMCLSGSFGDELEVEFLLQDEDLPPKHDGYLTLMSWSQFQKEFDETEGGPKVTKVMLGGKIRRVTTVLPMQISDGRVIPIPFIIDSGAPGLMYLGTGSLGRLKELNLINNKARTDVYQNTFHLMGTFYNEARSAFLAQPNVSEFPSEHEGASVKGDIRLNLIGLQGMAILKIDVTWD
uniref:Peptidase A2 domain-containing protein n=1 Tax=Amphimedon queenslandica TaxID=400682 RepID=A0A1X7V2R0_AMPQE